MIQITPQMRIWLAVEPVDFRKGIDGLAQVCRQHLKIDPMAGALAVFSSRRRKTLKCLVFDGYGNTGIMGCPFRPKRHFRGKTVFPVRDDGPIILTVSATGFVLGLPPHLSNLLDFAGMSCHR